MTAPLTLNVFTGWLATGERGISSETIVGHLTGTPMLPVRPREPLDPDDLRRCELLLRQVPLARMAFTHMRTASPAWAALVDEWAQLVTLLEEEVPGCLDTRHPHGEAPRCYARMRELRVLDHIEAP